MAQSRKETNIYNKSVIKFGAAISPMPTWAHGLSAAEKKNDPCALPQTQDSFARNGLFAPVVLDSITHNELWQLIPLVSDSKTPNTNEV